MGEQNRSFPPLSPVQNVQNIRFHNKSFSHNEHPPLAPGAAAGNWKLNKAEKSVADILIRPHAPMDWWLVVKYAASGRNSFWLNRTKLRSSKQVPATELSPR